MNVETLTEAGRRYAESAKYDSIVARVALAGYDSGWPLAHVEAAVRACNAKGAN